MLICLAGLESHSYVIVAVGCSSGKRAQTVFTWSLLGVAIIAVKTDVGTWSSACGTKIRLTCTELHAASAMHLGVRPAG